MKLSYKGEHNLQVTVDNPDERMSVAIRDELSDALHKEWRAFVEQCSVAIRELKPGSKRTLKSKPIVVSIESEAALKSPRASQEQEKGK